MAWAVWVEGLAGCLVVVIKLDSPLCSSRSGRVLSRAAGAGGMAAKRPAASLDMIPQAGGSGLGRVRAGRLRRKLLQIRNR